MTFAANALFGKTILVTGGSSGLGRAAAQGIAACGGRVALAGRDEGRLGTVRASLAGSGHSLVVGRLDTIEEAAGLVSRVAEDCGGLDGIFHSAGCYELVPARMVSTRHVETVMGAALMGGLGIAKAAGSTGTMRPGASIVMMSSVAARRGRACVAVYSAAKAGIEGLIRSLAKEFVPRSVRVNAVAAGAVKTPLLDRGHKMLPDASAKAIEAAHPLGIGEPSDVANAVLFLLSDASRWMTGTVLDVDGGYLGS